MLRRTFIKSGCALTAGVGTLVLVESKISYYDVVEHYKEAGDSITEEDEELLIKAAKSVVETDIGILALYYSSILSVLSITFEKRKEIAEIIAPLIIEILKDEPNSGVIYNKFGIIREETKKEMIKVAKENFI